MRMLFVRSVPVVAFIGVLALSGCQANSPAPTNKPVITIASPAANTSVSGPKVKIDASVSHWQLVAANQAAKPGEGHLHFYIDIPADAIKVGEGIPLDQAAKFVHAGKAPFTSREIELAPGQHTVTVVMGNSVHQVLAEPAPVSVTFTVNAP
jgi:hypothetical protein